jgi:transposase
MRCGASPIPASSGTTVRHRLNRGGNRHANTALDRIVVVLMGWHQPTRDDLARQTTQGLSKKEIIRCLKRYIARDVFAALPVPTLPAQAA